jgi:hypothetical protein
MGQCVVNEKVEVTALGFRKNLATYPKRIEFRGKTYSFIDAGLRCLVKSSGLMAEIFTLSDGEADYRLRRDNSTSVWTLLSIAS